MSAYIDRFDRTVLGNNYHSPQTWQITDHAVHCTTSVAGGYLAVDSYNDCIASVIHAEDQASGKLGVYARGGVRLVCDPSDGWTWSLERPYYFYNEATYDYELAVHVWDSWTGQGAPAGRRTTLSAQGNVYKAYLDDVLLGTYVHNLNQNLNDSRWGIATDFCTASIEQLTIASGIYELIGYDNFDRPDLGTTAPGGTSYIGAPGWEIVYAPSPQNSYLRTVGAGDRQLVFDTQHPDTELQIGSYYSGSIEVGIILRWTDTQNFLAFTYLPTAGRERLYKREAGVLTVLGEWSYAPLYQSNTQLAVRQFGSYVEASIDYQVIGTVEVDYNLGSTVMGLWARDGVAAFDALMLARRYLPVSVPEPAALGIRGDNLERNQQLQPFHARIHGTDDPFIYRPYVLEPGNLHVVGGDSELTDKVYLRRGGLQLRGADGSFFIPPLWAGGPNNPAPLGSGRQPIALRPVIEGPIGLIDEHGNIIVDEDDEVLTFD